MAVPSVILIRWAKPVACLLMAAPLAWLIWQWASLLMDRPHGLGFNPQEFSNRYTGRWGLRLLLLGLALSPLADLTKSAAPIALRRMVGLFAFSYGAVHLLSYVALDQLFGWTAIWQDIVKRWYITVGFAAFVMLIPLAFTSTNAMIRRLGAKRWKRLHRLVFPAACLIVLHFQLIVKGNQMEPMVYAIILGILLLWRLVGKKLWKGWRTGKRRHHTVQQ